MFGIALLSDIVAARPQPRDLQLINKATWQARASKQEQARASKKQARSKQASNWIDKNQCYLPASCCEGDNQASRKFWLDNLSQAATVLLLLHAVAAAADVDAIGIIVVLQSLCVMLLLTLDGVTASAVIDDSDEDPATVLLCCC